MKSDVRTEERKRVKVGIIGVGYMGKLHLKAFLSSEKAEVVGVYDINPERAQEAREAFGVNAFHTMEELLDSVEAVSIATPTEVHFKVAKEVIERGKHLLLEKPITHEVSLGQRLIGEARKRNVVFQIGHIERYNPAVQELLKRVRAPFRIESERYGYPVNRNLQAGVILDLMIHDVDIVLKMLKEEPLSYRVRAWSIYSEGDDFGEAMIDFPSAVVYLKVSRVHPYKSRKMRVWDRVGDTLRLFELDFMEQSLEIYTYPSSPEDFGTRGPIRERVEVEKQDLIKLEVESFLSAIINGEEPLVGAEDGLKALNLVLQLKGSLERLRKATG